MKKTSIFIFTLLICVSSFGQLTSEAEKCIIKGIEYHKKGQYDKAIEEYDKALIFDKDNVFAYSEKAMTLLRQKRERSHKTLRKSNRNPSQTFQLRIHIHHLGNLLQPLRNAL